MNANQRETSETRLWRGVSCGIIYEIVKSYGRCYQQPLSGRLQLNKTTDNLSQQYDDSTDQRGWYSPAPNFLNGVHCIVPFRWEGGAVMSKATYLRRAQEGREGWVYLIHAEGTERYKIGRSVNPIGRHQTLQNQSPFPLTIVNSFWTIDAIADEADLHRQFAEFRTYGEWFEFSDRCEHSSWRKFILQTQFNYLSWINNSTGEVIDRIISLSCMKDLGTEEDYKSFSESIVPAVFTLYEFVNSAESYNYVQTCLEEIIEVMEQIISPLSLQRVEFFILGVTTTLVVSLKAKER